LHNPSLNVLVFLSRFHKFEFRGFGQARSTVQINSKFGLRPRVSRLIPLEGVVESLYLYHQFEIKFFRSSEFVFKRCFYNLLSTDTRGSSTTCSYPGYSTRSNPNLSASLLSKSSNQYQFMKSHWLNSVLTWEQTSRPRSASQ
jgi:hypothetical protein